MPRSLEYILAHADEYADWFEQYEPQPGDERDVGAFTALRDAVEKRATAERTMLEAVRQARAAKYSWGLIGIALGTSGEAARQRYARLVAPAPDGHSSA
jgi:hypothetical protein